MKINPIKKCYLIQNGRFLPFAIIANVNCDSMLQSYTMILLMKNGDIDFRISGVLFSLRKKSLCDLWYFALIRYYSMGIYCSKRSYLWKMPKIERKSLMEYFFLMTFFKGDLVPNRELWLPLKSLLRLDRTISHTVMFKILETSSSNFLIP